MTTAVYFDLDGTLCTYTQGFERQFEGAVNPYGEPTQRAYAVYVEALFDALEHCGKPPIGRRTKPWSSERVSRLKSPV